MSPGVSTTTSPCCSSNAAADTARLEPGRCTGRSAPPNRGDVCAPSHGAGRRVNAGRRPVRKTRAARFDAAVKVLRDPLPGRDNGRSVAGCRSQPPRRRRGRPYLLMLLSCCLGCWVRVAVSRTATDPCSSPARQDWPAMRSGCRGPDLRSPGQRGDGAVPPPATATPEPHPPPAPAAHPAARRTATPPRAAACHWPSETEPAHADRSAG
jgi:hypothetical protein